MKIWISSVAFLFSALVSAQEAINASLQPVTIFPVSQLLETSFDEPVTVVDTGIIRDSNGLLARGPHDVKFSLLGSSPYSVIVEGITLNPGESHTFNINVSDNNGRVILPVYAAAPDVEGVAQFSLNIPLIDVRVCPDTFSEGEVDCYRFDYGNISYSCNDGLASYESATLDCRRWVYEQVIESCDTDEYAQTPTQCERSFTEDANPNCPAGAGWSWDGANCQYFDTVAIDDCPAEGHQVGSKCHEIRPKSDLCADGWVLNVPSGECEQVQTVTEASTLGCPSGSDNGSSCTLSSSTGASFSCSSGNWMAWAQCYQTHSLACPSNMQLYGYYCREDTDPDPDRTWYVTRHNACGWQGYILAGGACQQYLTNATVSCPSGYSQSGSGDSARCVRSYTQAYSYYCGSGWDLSGDQLNCSQDTTVSQASFPGCLTSESELDVAQCFANDPDFSMGNCSAPHALNSTNGDCEDTATQAPNFTCPADPSYTLNVSQCDFFHVLPLDLSCNQNYGLDEPNYRCEQQLVSQANFICADDGYEADAANDRCVNEVREDFR